MSLVTCCPKCKSEYEVTADQLKLHDGLVRCGHCSHVFDGFACLKDSLPTLTRKVSQLQPSQPAQPTQPAMPVSQRAPASTPVLNARADTPGPAAAPKPRLKLKPKTDQSAAPGDESPSEQPKPAAVVPSATVSASSSAPPTAAPAPVTPRNDGPFIPSVDRMRSQSSSLPAGRQEPALVGAAAPVSTDNKEPSLGTFLHRQDVRGEGEREPVLGRIGDYANQRSPEKIELPPVRVVGESRVRGDDPSAFGRTVPEFLEEQEEPPEGVSLLWVVGSIVLAVVLIIQAMVVYRNDIASAAPGMRPFLVQLCKPLSCDVSYVRQINRIFIVGSSLQQTSQVESPANQRAYTLRLTLQNRWTHPQPWPALMLTLRDASGTAVIRKAILPSQYLSPNLLSGPMAARQEVSLEIPLVVDGLNISGYELERFFP